MIAPQTVVTSPHNPINPLTLWKSLKIDAFEANTCPSHTYRPCNYKFLLSQILVQLPVAEKKRWKHKFSQNSIKHNVIEKLKCLFNHLQKTVTSITGGDVCIRELIQSHSSPLTLYFTLYKWLIEQQIENTKIFCEITDKKEFNFLKPRLVTLEPTLQLETMGEWITNQKARISYREDLMIIEQKLTALPSDIKLFNHLQWLNLQSNKLSSLPKAITLLTRLEYFDISYNLFSSLPPALGTFVSLQQLKASHNQIHTIDPSIYTLSHLSVLELDHNKIKEIPPFIGNLRNLHTLLLGHNSLGKLPMEIGNLPIEYLDLSYNNFSLFPKEICRMPRLCDLFLNNNSLSFIPKRIGSLQSLFLFDLSNNRIESLPEEFEHLKCLSLLDLHNNQLTIFPYQLHRLPLLKHYYLYHNPLPSRCVELLHIGSLENEELVSILQKKSLTTDILEVKLSSYIDRIMSHTKAMLHITTQSCRLVMDHKDSHLLAMEFKAARTFAYDTIESVHYWYKDSLGFDIKPSKLNFTAFQQKLECLELWDEKGHWNGLITRPLKEILDGILESYTASLSQQL